MAHLKRIGIFGGSFDPVHQGHVALARLAQQQCRLDTVYVVPAKQPPHKLERTLAPAKHRLSMIRLALGGKVRISRFELSAKGTTYTWQTLAYFHGRFPQAEIFFILGGDSLSELNTWKYPERIARMCTILAGHRRGVTTAIPAAFKRSTFLLKGSIPRVSSTEIRDKAKKQHSIKRMVPHAVAAYINQHHLYENIE